MLLIFVVAIALIIHTFVASEPQHLVDTQMATKEDQYVDNRRDLEETGIE